MKLSNGQQVVLRREALGWNQTDLAKAVGVSLSTIVRVEADHPRVSPAMKAAVWRAIEEEERLRGTGPTLSTPPATTEPSQEGAADAATLHEAHKKLEALIDIMAASIEDIRRTMARLDARADQSKQKPA